ncbi:MAG: hypothetical protein ACTHKX_09740, partial [Pseudolysinimonas sp.]
MDEVVVLDAVAVAALAQATRDRAREADPAAADVLHGYAAELDDVAEAAVQRDQKEHEIEHQLRWWADRIRQLEAALTGHPADDMDTSRELALYRGRVSGAQTLRKHYVEQRRALLQRHTAAEAA